MCGIVGYTGDKQAGPILLESLKKLEYRGYDSAGVAVLTPDGTQEVVKCKGKLSTLFKMLDGGSAIAGCCGIGHTRWATHGEPSETNAHPHFNDDHTIVAVHNGIIENYRILKDKLVSKGYKFYSQTDTEIATKLVDYYYKKWKNPLEAMVSFSLRARGSFALAVMFTDYPGEVFVARNDSPLIIGVKDGESYIASDVPAILKYTRDVYYMGNMEIARVGKGSVKFYDVDSRELKKSVVHVDWDMQSAEKGGFEHFMMKEIQEQPEVIKQTLNSYISDGQINFASANLTNEDLKKVERVYFVACGSAYHTGVVGKYVIEGLAKIATQAQTASEFRYASPVMGKNDLVVVVSQSGETADTLAGLREAKKRGIKTLAIVNVVGSSIAREADHVLYTLAGPEISVATTKAYSAQLVINYLLAIQLAFVNGRIDKKRYNSLISALHSLPDNVKKIISDDEELKCFASKISVKHDAYFIGRGIDYASCMECSLKLKEISYIHSSAYPAGELKHGTISLIEEGTVVFGIATRPDLMEKTASSMQEVKSRGAYVMCITNSGNYSFEKIADFTVYIPKTEPYFSASLSVIPMQIISYYVSVSKGIDVDKPRNLAKCVTVE